MWPKGGAECRLAVPCSDNQICAPGDRSSPRTESDERLIDGGGDGKAHDDIPSLVIQTRSAVIGS